MDDTALSDKEILEKFAFIFFKRRESMGFAPDKEKDWRMAEELFAHITHPDPEDMLWRLHDEDVTDEMKNIFRRRSLNA